VTRRRRTGLVAAATAAIVIASNASEGAYFSQSWGWVALAFLVPTTVVLIVDRSPVPGRLRVAFLVLMGAFAGWTALSALWSISSSASVREFERTLVYVALAFAVAFLLRRGDVAGLLAGALAGVVAVVSYGLATRLLPERFDTVDDPFNAYRLAEPLGYWNSFGLLAALGLILAVGVVAHARRAPAVVAAAATVPLLCVALYFTFSRGSWIALGFGLLATVMLDPRRLRLIWSMLLLAPAPIVGVAVASRQEALTTEDSTVSAAAHEGSRLAWLLAGLVVLSAALGWLAHRVAQRVEVGPRARRTVDLALALGAAAAVALALVAAGGPRTAVDELRERFEADPTAAGADLNERLFSVSGNGRAETIGVAWDVGREHPVAGAGSGTFEYSWYERRPSRQIVRDAHSLYAEVFDELGIVGLAMLLTALAVPVAAALRSRRARYVAPAAGAYLAWVAAAGLDWHWEMVGLTLTAFLAGAVALLAAERGRSRPLGDGARLALIGMGAAASFFAVWSLVGNQALFASRAAAERREWSEALEDGRRARSLLVWSHEPELAIGRAEAGRGDREAALRSYRAAVAQDSENWVAWLQLAQVSSGAERAAAYDRVRELNPREEGLPGE
jgi:O-antigen ligase